MNSLENKKLLFIHIPKTGGTSISEKLKEMGLNIWNRDYKFLNHDPLFMLSKNNNLSEAFKFTVVRNPYTRAYSYYIHFKRVNGVEVSFYDFLLYVKISFGNNLQQFFKLQQNFMLLYFCVKSEKKCTL